ncbi:MAG: hypothetical protein ACXAEU_19750 [Candidatus Hodarchaeales archaeon]
MTPQRDFLIYNCRVQQQKHAFKEFLASKNTCHIRIPSGKPQKNGIVERAVQNVKVEACDPSKAKASWTSRNGCIAGGTGIISTAHTWELEIDVLRNSSSLI